MAALLSTFGRRLYKACRLLEDPRLVALHRQGVDVDAFERFRRPWFAELGINTVLDIGANTGQFARLMREVLPHARIYSFEPLPDCFRALREWADGTAGVHAYNCGIGSAEGELTIFRNPYADTSSFRPMTELCRDQFPFTQGEQRPISVPVRPLDSLEGELEIEPGLMVKIDVQGFEDEVIAGGRRLLSRARLVIMEVSFAPLYDGVASFDALYASMREMGFEFRGFLDQLVGPADGAVLQGDAMFLKSGT